MNKKKFKKVLFIDEDAETVKIYHSILEQKKLSGQLVYMANAQEGFNYLRKLKRREMPDYVLLDLNHSQVAGLEFLQQFEGLGKMRKPIEVFVCTSIVNKDDRNKVMKFPFVSAFLEKPLPSDFLELLITDDLHPAGNT
ncbi:MAG: response regulator [Mangrovibacterium sp.]